MSSIAPLSLRVFGLSLLPVFLLVASCGGGGGGGGGSVAPVVAPPVDVPIVPDVLLPRTRYGLNNQCFAVQALSNDNFLVADGNGYTATAESAEEGEAFFFKPSALGSYLLYNRNRLIVAENGSAIELVALDAATDSAVFTLFTEGDSTVYPAPPEYNVEPTPEVVDTYRAFVDPNLESTDFRIVGTSGNALNADSSGAITVVAANGTPDQTFRMHRLSAGCADFPEAQSNVRDQTETFKGTTSDGRVLGMVDAHVHISATTFLGESQWGSPFHKFGVTHALDDCDEYHGPAGNQDEVSPIFNAGEGAEGHDTTGWPSFPFWPARDALTHEAIYWRWLERSWKAGLRVAVNELVDNQTLCEIQRNASQDPLIDCNPMNNAGFQVGTMFAMQDYIDAQYGGRGEGFFQIVYDSAEARSVVEDGKMAVVLGIEISNLFNCQPTFSLGHTAQSNEETADSAGVGYGCTMSEDDGNGNLPENSILFQMQRIYDIGVRKIISIHEFDNAFGGNGIFLAFLNLGTFENSRGEVQGVAGSQASGAPGTGEFWVTYDCPVEGEIDPDTNEPFDYLWGSQGGEDFTESFPGGCPYTGLPGSDGMARPGGATPCYPATRQCNARWMTPIGLYMYSKMMEMGFMFDIDHMELEMKTQALELAEAQVPVYPFVSTHGTFGGTSVDQARRILRNGGFMYPSNGSTSGFINDMAESLSVYEAAMQGIPVADRPIFGFGFGTDTNGLSAQTSPRGMVAAAANPIRYPFILFSDAEFAELSDFSTITGVIFDQPSVTDAGQTTPARTWHQDEDGNAHHGMLADWVQEIQLEGDRENIRHLYNSAEAFLQTWERTERSHQGIVDRGGQVTMPANGVLREAPTPDELAAPPREPPGTPAPPPGSPESPF